MSAKSPSFVLRPIIFLSQWRSLPYYELISYVLMFASVPMLAYGVKLYNNEILIIIILTVLTLYCGFFAALIWNDITDADIDAVIHPKRPIPSKRLSSKKFFIIALIFSAFTFIFSFLVSIKCFFLVGLAALFVAFHNKFLKKKIKLPAYSEIFTPIQWTVVPIFGFLAVDSTNIQNIVLLVLFTYFADGAHDIPEGIHDVEGDRMIGIRTYATSFGEKNAARISFVMFLLSGSIGIILFMRSILTLIFLIPFLGIWLYTLYHSYKFFKVDKPNMKKIGGKIGRKGFNYFLLSYNLIFLDLLVQIFIFNF